MPTRSRAQHAREHKTLQGPKSTRSLSGSPTSRGCPWIAPSVQGFAHNCASCCTAGLHLPIYPEKGHSPTVPPRSGGRAPTVPGRRRALAVRLVAARRTAAPPHGRGKRGVRRSLYLADHLGSYATGGAHLLRRPPRVVKPGPTRSGRTLTLRCSTLPDDLALLAFAATDFWLDGRGTIGRWGAEGVTQAWRRRLRGGARPAAAAAAPPLTRVEQAGYLAT